MDLPVIFLPIFGLQLCGQIWYRFLSFICSRVRRTLGSC